MHKNYVVSIRNTKNGNSHRLNYGDYETGLKVFEKSVSKGLASIYFCEFDYNVHVIAQTNKHREFEKVFCSI